MYIRYNPQVGVGLSYVHIYNLKFASDTLRNKLILWKNFVWIWIFLKEKSFEMASTDSSFRLDQIVFLW